jgi:tetratricopeptide (TPR) repeat protein
MTSPGEPERAQAFSNRSAVLMAVGHFRDAARDAERALQNNYPDAMRFRLYLRKALCFRELGEVEKAVQELQMARDSIAR